MRRILISNRDEFSYPSKTKTSRDLAVKKLSFFYKGVEKKELLSEKVIISNKRKID